MRTILLLISFIVSFISAAQMKNNEEYIEGFIDYALEFKSQMQGVSDNEIRERIGSKLRIYFTENNLKWVFTDESDYVRSYIITDLGSNMEYSWSDDNPDTIYSFENSSERRIKTDSIVEEGIGKVLDCVCRVVKFWTSHAFEEFSSTQEVTSQYYFCPDYPLDPEPYKKVKEMKWGEVVSKQRSVALRIDTQFENLFAAKFIATSVTREKPDKSMFNIDKSKVIKPTFAE